MIAHFILLKLREGGDADLVTAEVQSLGGSIPGLLSVDGGPGVIPGPNAWDLGFLMVFDHEEAARAYQDHPAHRRVAGVIGAHVSGLATCDVRRGADASPVIGAPSESR